MAAAIERAGDWPANMLPDVADDEKALRKATTAWRREQAAEEGVDDATWELYELANPSWMAALGLKRFWQKHLAET